MTKKEQLLRSYGLFSQRYHGERLYTLTHFFELFEPSLEKLRTKSGAMHCTNINRLFKAELLASGLFSETDIKTRWTLLWYVSPHQYLQIKTEDGWTSVDIWAKTFGIGFGDHAHGFHA